MPRVYSFGKLGNIMQQNPGSAIAMALVGLSTAGREALAERKQLKINRDKLVMKAASNPVVAVKLAKINTRLRQLEA